MSQIIRHNLRAGFGKFCSRFIKSTKKRKYEVLYNKPRVDEQISTDWGRRIVEIKTLAKELWCLKCDIPLSLENIESEKQFGLSNIFRIKCLVIALIDAGIGEAQ
ncbi:hypothetical protein PV327_011201 [Microctonus hyperodae]|uniref:Uncharacterized protein n=1 Tax=Microctonus hyperodae TaxID=165561 RepID=A0AA39F0J1_MICHY|nr:hypothetical protein PV327_011201 [Microctonus hyperodae]